MNDETLKDLLEKATKGPWRVFGKKTGEIISENAPGIVEIGTIGDFDDDELVPFNAERWHADSRIIALAPQLAAEVINLQAEVERLREALVPFAEAADECDDCRYGDYNQAPVTAGDCRNARAVLEETKET